MSKINFSKNLRELRKSKRKTQKELSIISGISQSYISELELGYKSPTLKTLETLSVSLKVNLSELITLG